MDFFELVSERHSTRKYSAQKVEQKKMNQIIEAARLAPSAHNKQAYKLIVVDTEEAISKIGKAGNIYGANTAIIVCEDRDKAWTNPYNGRQLVSHDSVIATDHMMLEATELGVDSVWVCWFDPQVIKNEFALPENLEPVNILVLGYGMPINAERPQKQRKTIAELMYHA